MRSAECIICTELPDLQSIYSKWDWTKDEKNERLQSSEQQNVLSVVVREARRLRKGQHRETDEELLPTGQSDL